MAYKRELISTNQPIQLLDKSTFYTLSSGGTTATYNNDGTFTVSGTATASWWKNYPVFQLLPNGGEHVYLFDVGAMSNSTTTCCNIYFYDERTDRAVFLITAGGEEKAKIATANVPQSFQARFNITTLTGATPNNIVYKPQLFDLTAIFGAGNEPKTVAEFKAKFPNELYDYRTSNSLTSYKKLLKVSDVCQLLDKSKYPATRTTNGVTYTNNGDGIVTVSGTTTGPSAYILIDHVRMVGHKYLVCGCPANGSFNTYRLTANIHKDGIYVNGFSDAGDGNISKVLEAGEEISIVIDIANISDANLVFKPQLFDLTEMYGAGNEPSTVAEFKAKFLNELYDYSPNCWVRSYKTGLIAQTKNLFNISKVDTTTTLNVSGNAISAKNTSSDPSEWTYANSQYKTTLEAGTYHLSFDNINTASSVNHAVGVLCRSDAGTWIARISDAAFANNKVQNSFTLTEKTNVGFQFKLYTQVISNIQLEKGTTATDYVPYGYL